MDIEAEANRKNDFIAKFLKKQGKDMHADRQYFRKISD